jgi:hypothetical protein
LPTRFFQQHPVGWMDEQLLESYPVCAAFPDDMRRIMEIYSGLPYYLKQKFMKAAEVFSEG